MLNVGRSHYVLIFFVGHAICHWGLRLLVDEELVDEPHIWSVRCSSDKLSATPILSLTLQDLMVAQRPQLLRRPGGVRQLFGLHDLFECVLIIIIELRIVSFQRMNGWHRTRLSWGFHNYQNYIWPK
jgi:hypothetical protein